MSQELRELVRKYTLQNAINYEGKANPGPVIGKIMMDPDMRDRIGEVKEIVLAVVDEVNGLSLEEQIEILKEEAPELLEREKIARVAELSKLEGTEGGVVMRLAPNPSGPLHIGHTRMAILNDEYVKRYGGKLIVRMEDTNPPTILPEAYDMIMADLDFLGVEVHEVVNQSERFEIYYEHATKLLEIGAAYMCSCIPDDWRKLKEEGKACPHRDVAPEAQLDLWKRMLADEFGEEEISLVVKTNLQHPNPAVRDFVGMRIVNAPHPKTGDKYKVYPLYNFSVAVDDHLMGMTHVLRGKDHLNNTIRQEYVYDYLGWKKPIFIHYGWVSIDDTILSTRQIKAAINDGQYTGWDDVCLGTVTALARRGIQPNAIRKFWIEVGTGDVDIKFSWANLFAYNKDIIHPIARRYFFVWAPTTIEITGIQSLEGKVRLHPDNPEMGEKVTSIKADENCIIRLVITAEDLSNLKPGYKVRLKDLCNLEYQNSNKFTYIGNDLSILKEGVGIIHWVPVDNLPTKVMMPDGEIIEGVSELATTDAVEEVIQFERFGFLKVEMAEDGSIVGYFGHK